MERQGQIAYTHKMNLKHTSNAHKAHLLCKALSCNIYDSASCAHSSQAFHQKFALLYFFFVRNTSIYLLNVPPWVSTHFRIRMGKFISYDGKNSIYYEFTCSQLHIRTHTCAKVVFHQRQRGSNNIIVVRTASSKKRKRINIKKWYKIGWFQKHLTWDSTKCCVLLLLWIRQQNDMLHCSHPPSSRCSLFIGSHPFFASVGVVMMWNMINLAGGWNRSLLATTNTTTNVSG